MREDFLMQQLREAMQRRRQQLPEEHWRELIAAGIIDEEGRVLKRAPEPPEESNQHEEMPATTTAPLRNGDNWADDSSTKPIRESLRVWDQLSPEIQWQKLVEAGVIDEQGQVMQRSPEVPKRPGTPASGGS